MYMYKLYVNFSKKRALYILFNSIAHFKYQRALVILLRIEILQHRVLNNPTSTDTKSNSCNSRVGMEEDENFQSREKGIVSA